MSVDLRAIKRARLDAVQGQETINQVEHVASAGARLVMGDALVPGDVITSDASLAQVKVGVGNILRVQVAADTYVAFTNGNTSEGDLDLSGGVSVTTTPGLKLPAGYHILVATGEFMRCSANPTRIEVIKL